MLEFKIKTYQQLTKEELYEILRLRAEVFIVEQNCVYQDIDNKDQKAIHVLGYKNNKLIAYTRIFKSGDYFKNASIGRVLVVESERNNQYGFTLIKTSITLINKHFNEFIIEISAQEHLEKFYNTLEFTKFGNSYLEDGIPHIKMIKS